ncbi:MAG: hypothetical protein HC771_00420 [Synechococcales cyanobacterium CRU_2_2]|nr:hypothetical protein [Synechococcales cyanobacterium CRU_2_2]
MDTQFITLTLALQPTSWETRQQVEAAIAPHGTPLRWAITRIDRDRQTFQIEAIVLTSPYRHLPCSATGVHALNPLALNTPWAIALNQSDSQNNKPHRV